MYSRREMKDFHSRGLEEEDWRSQIDSMYSGSEYNELISASSKVSQTLDSIQGFDYKNLDSSTRRKVLDAIRFPPFERVTLPPAIASEEFKPAVEYISAVNARRASLASAESMAGLKFLEGMLDSMLTKAVEIRDAIQEHGRYIYALARIPSDEDRDYMRTVIPENLQALRSESFELIEQIGETFEVERVEHMIQSQESSMTDMLLVIKASMLERTTKLKNEMMNSTIVIDGLTRVAEAINNIPDEKICQLDGIITEWDAFDKLQAQIVSSNRSLNFAAYMTSFGFPVCDAVHEYLQSTKSFANTLAIVNYPLQPGELATILDFFDIQHRNMRIRNKQAETHFCSVYRSVRTLILYNCALTDKDCHSLSSKLPKFINLDVLNLRNNRIAFSGIASIASIFFDRGSNLRCLRLDGNRINTEGALIIAEMLQKMPLLEVLSLSSNKIRDMGLYHILRHTMNRQRAAYKTLPRPGPSELYGRDRKHSVWSDSFAGGRAYGGGGGDSGSDDGTEGDGGGSGLETENYDLMLESSEFDMNSSTVRSTRETAAAATVTDLGKMESAQERAYKRKIQKKCYYADYFAVHHRSSSNRHGSGRHRQHRSRRGRANSAESTMSGSSSAESSGTGADDDDEEEEDEFDFEDDYVNGGDDDDDDDNSDQSGDSKEEWINDKEDEFFPDDNSEYSSTPIITALVQAELQAGRYVEGVSRTRTISGEDAGSEKNRTNKATQAPKTVPKIIQLFIKARLKLVAVNMFLRLLRTKCILSSLNIANCNLTDAAVVTLSHALKSNHNITALDVSDNPLLLATYNGCNSLADMMERSSLRSLALNRCGIRDKGFMNILKAASNCITLRSLEISRNHIGPTGANWVATANKTFYLDQLAISGGFHASAPFAKVGDAALGDTECNDFEDEEEDANSSDEKYGGGGGGGRFRGGKGRIGDQQRLGYGADDGSDTNDESSYVDTDLFDGDEVDDDEEEEDEGEEEAGEGYDNYIEEHEDGGGGGDYDDASAGRISNDHEMDDVHEDYDEDDESESAVQSRIDLL